jgi:hypothetical protein
MRRSLPPLRTSSHSAEFGVDVEGHPNLGLAYLQFHREPAVSGLHPGHQQARPTPNRELAYDMASRRRDDQLERSSATQISEEEI